MSRPAELVVAGSVMRLLVVEDESLLRQQLEQGLSREGYVVDVAEDGKIGLYHATENDFDAAIIDLGLPEIDPRQEVEKLLLSILP